jgi:oligoendopeptidase F
MQLEEVQAGELSDSTELALFRHYLQNLRKYKPHTLSEPEEKILAEKGPIGSSWGTLFDKVLSRLRFGEGQKSESEVLSELYHPDREVRKKAAADLTDGLNSIDHILTHIFNTILLDKAIEDRLRKYPHWLRARNLSNEADDEMVSALIKAVSTRYDLVSRYYQLKRKILGYDQLFDYDRYAPIPSESERAIPWDEAKETVLAAFNAFSPQMGSIAQEFFDRNWIHAPVLPGKRSGAFSHPVIPSVHPYILLNYTGKRRDVMTLAHELGHGIHQYLAREQGLFNGDTPLTTAESDSVFGEMLVFRHLLGQIESPTERVVLLCGKLEDIFATVFRQVSMNRFEEAVHTRRREHGELDTDTLCTLWMDTQKTMFGNSVTLMDHYRIWWSYIPHFVHSPGYVYAYAFGELLVLALYRQYLERGSSFIPLYLDLLRSGGKVSPGELLRPFGIDLADPDFWIRGLKVLEELLMEAEAAMASVRGL